MTASCMRSLSFIRFGPRPKTFSGVGGLEDGVDIGAEPFEEGRQLLAFLSTDAVANLLAEAFVHGVEALDKGGTLVGDPDQPDRRSWGSGLRVTSPRVSSWSIIAARRPTDSDEFGELGLVGTAEVVDEGEQRRLVQVEVEFGEAVVEGIPQAPGRVDQRNLGATPRRRAAGVIGRHHWFGTFPYSPMVDNSGADNRSVPGSGPARLTRLRWTGVTFDHIARLRIVRQSARSV